VRARARIECGRETARDGGAAAVRGHARVRARASTRATTAAGVRCVCHVRGCERITQRARRCNPPVVHKQKNPSTPPVPMADARDLQRRGQLRPSAVPCWLCAAAALAWALPRALCVCLVCEGAGGGGGGQLRMSWSAVAQQWCLRARALDVWWGAHWQRMHVRGPRLWSATPRHEVQRLQRPLHTSVASM
jgi:hypothetical protein